MRSFDADVHVICPCVAGKGVSDPVMCVRVVEEFHRNALCFFKFKRRVDGHDERNDGLDYLGLVGRQPPQRLGAALILRSPSEQNNDMAKNSPDYRYFPIDQESLLLYAERFIGSVGKNHSYFCGVYRRSSDSRKAAHIGAAIFPHRTPCFWRRLRQSAIMAMNSEFVGLPFIFDTV